LAGAARLELEAPNGTHAMKRVAKRIGPVLGLLIVAGVWLYFTPHITHHRMKKAAENADGAAFTNYVDFAALRASLRTNLLTAVVQQAGSTNAQISAFQRWYLDQARIPDKMLDQFLTPEKLSPLIGARSRTNISAKAAAITSRRYLDRHSFAIEQNGTRPILTRHGLARWKLSSIDGAIMKP
jgi:hypothetical protein